MSATSRALLVLPMLVLSLRADATQQPTSPRPTPQTTNRRDAVAPEVTAVEKLIETHDPQAAAKVAKLLDHPNPKVATQACVMVGESGDPSLAPAALRGLGRESNSSVQEACATALGQLNAAEGVDALNRVAESDRQPLNLRLAAIHALSMTAADRAGSLVSLLKNSDRRIRAAAGYSACQLRIKDAVAGIAVLATDPDPEVRQAAIDAMSLWPEAFSNQLLAIASNANETQENRILGLTALDAFPAEQKTAALVKSVSTLLDVQQSPDIQLASVQLLSRVPEARPALEQFAQKPGISPEVLTQMEIAGIEPNYTAAKPMSTSASGSYREQHSDNSAWIGVIGGIAGGLLVIGGNLLLEWFKQRAKKKRDEPRKEILRKMLRDERFPERWRKLRTLMHVIGADEATTKRLLIEIGARGSEDGEELWGLIEDHPFGKKD